MSHRSTYPNESAGSLMNVDVPTARPSSSIGSVLHDLSKGSWDDIHVVYIISEEKKLLGVLPIHKLFLANRDDTIDHLIEHIKVKTHPKTDQEKVIIDAIRSDVKSVPVIDEENHLLGAITADQIIDVLHEEHLEDSLRSSGIRGRGSKILELMTDSISYVIVARLPWLLVGLGVGLVASFIVSRFEHFLNQHVALAFFISMIAYMSDAVGTQTETIFIRAITFTKFNIVNYLVRELSVGMVMGSLLGLLAGLAAFGISGSFHVGLSVGLALLASMTVATVLACVVPLILRAVGKDPAVGSGPFTTAVQDLLSIAIYFVIAFIILGS